MQTHFLFDLMAEHPQFARMLEQAKQPGAVIAASGLSGAQKAHLACALSERTGRPLLYLCDSERAAAETTIACFRGYADCVEGAREMGVICGMGVYERGKVAGTSAMAQAYEMGTKV